MKRSLEILGAIIAATIGSGVFALPYIIQRSGWLLSLGYFIALIAIVSIAHILYLRTLETAHEKKTLLGLTREHFKGTGFWVGFFAIVIGLLLGFVGYLVLGSKFISIIFPAIPAPMALAIFWAVIAILIFKSGGSAAVLEIAGVVLISISIIFIFFSGDPLHLSIGAPLASAKNFFLPFGAVLFSLTGWTSVEQIYEIRRKQGKKKRDLLFFVFGAAFAGLLYWLFSLGVLNSVMSVSADTISSIGVWPVWKKDLVAIVGLLAMGVVAIPLSREIRGALEKELKWNRFTARSFIALAPLALILLGLNNFLVIVSLAGGIFLGVQYILIISIGRNALKLSFRERSMLDFLIILFACFAIYEIAAFIVH